MISNREWAIRLLELERRSPPFFSCFTSCLLHGEKSGVRFPGLSSFFFSVLLDVNLSLEDLRSMFVGYYSRSQWFLVLLGLLLKFNWSV